MAVEMGVPVQHHLRGDLSTTQALDCCELPLLILWPSSKTMRCCVGEKGYIREDKYKRGQRLMVSARADFAQVGMYPL